MKASIAIVHRVQCLMFGVPFLVAHLFGIKAVDGTAGLVLNTKMT